MGMYTNMMWYRFTLTWATFAIKVVDGVVVLAAPIAGWTLGHPIANVLTYYNRRGFEITKMEE